MDDDIGDYGGDMADRDMENDNICSACIDEEHDFCKYKTGDEYWCDCECLQKYA